MKARDEQRQHMIERLSEHLLRTGLAEASLRQLAAAAGVSDRMLLYYFDDKTEVMSAAMGRIAAEMVGRLEVAIPPTRLPVAELVPRAAAIVLEADTRPYMRLWVEVVAAAARREEPFAEIAQQIVAGFFTWIEARLEPPKGTNPRDAAAAVLAIVDGMALLDICAGREVTARATQSLASLMAGHPHDGPGARR